MATFVNNRHKSQEHESPDQEKAKKVVHSVDPSKVETKQMTPKSKHLMRKKYLMRGEQSDLSIRERIDINEKSIEDLKRFVEQDPDTTDFQVIIDELNSKARDINKMSLELKTRLLKTLSKNPRLDFSIKQDFLQSIS